MRVFQALKVCFCEKRAFWFPPDHTQVNCFPARLMLTQADYKDSGEKLLSILIRDPTVCQSRAKMFGQEKRSHCYTIKPTKILGRTIDSSMVPRAFQLGPESRNSV